MSRKNTPTDLWSLVNRSAPGECWPYQGRATTRGYGQMSISGKRLSAHVIAYELANGPVPAGHVVDHACHNRDPHCPGGVCPHRLCCNPAHLEAVTSDVNMRRSPHHNAAKTHCPNGHLYDEANTARRYGARYCRTCTNSHRPGGPADGAGCPGPQG